MSTIPPAGHCNWASSLSNPTSVSQQHQHAPTMLYFAGIVHDVCLASRENNPTMQDDACGANEERAVYNAPPLFDPNIEDAGHRGQQDFVREYALTKLHHTDEPPAKTYAINDHDIPKAVDVATHNGCVSEAVEVTTSTSPKNDEFKKNTLSLISRKRTYEHHAYTLKAKATTYCHIGMRYTFYHKNYASECRVDGELVLNPLHIFRLKNDEYNYNSNDLINEFKDNELNRIRSLSEKHPNIFGNKVSVELVYYSEKKKGFVSLGRIDIVEGIYEIIKIYPIFGCVFSYLYLQTKFIVNENFDITKLHNNNEMMTLMRARDPIIDAISCCESSPNLTAALWNTVFEISAKEKHWPSYKPTTSTTNANILSKVYHRISKKLIKSLLHKDEHCTVSAVRNGTWMRHTLYGRLMNTPEEAIPIDKSWIECIKMYIRRRTKQECGTEAKGTRNDPNRHKKLSETEKQQALAEYEQMKEFL